MGLIAIPKFQRVLVGGNILASELPDLEELGRLWIKSKKEAKEIKMAFEIIDIGSLPVREFGRTATEPRVGLAVNGRFVFNKVISKAWGETVDRLVVQYDKTARVLRFIPVKKGVMLKDIPANKYLKVSLGMKGKEGAKTFEGISAGGAGILTLIGYNYKAAGNQVYEAKLQAGKEGKGLSYDIVIPEKTPTPKPVTKRVKRDKGVQAANGKPNGAVAPPPPAEAELEIGLE